MSIKYSEDHEWVDAKEDDLVVIGITDFAQEQLGDLVYVELPEVGDECTKGDNISVIESVKAASDLVAPVSGSIIEVNSRIKDEPAIVTEASMGEGWFIKVTLSDPADLDDSLDEEAYNSLIYE